MLEEKGYSHVAEMLKGDSDNKNIPHLVFPELGVNKNTTYTIFAPIDGAFDKSYMNSNLQGFEGYPSLSRMRYQVVPFAVTKDKLESRSMFGQNLDTLVQGHPIVVATSETEGWTGLATTINSVTVLQFDVYNDGKLIIHGTERFFNPDRQRFEYPWFNGPTEANYISPSTSYSGAQSHSFSLFYVFLLSVLVLLL